MKIAGHRLLINYIPLEERDETVKRLKKAGLVVAEDEDTKRREATVDRGVVAQIGPDAWKAFYLNANPSDIEFRGFEPWCKVGDLISFAKYSAVVYEEKGKKYLVINDEDVIAVLEKE